MKLTRLNLQAVRESCRQPADPVRGEHALSRREVLQLAGAATVGATPAAHALEHVGERVTVHETRSAVAFLLDGKPRWVVDTRCFAGTPRVVVTRTEGSTRVVLSGARYPGTNFSADFVAELRHSLTGPRLRLWLALGNFEAEMSAEKFLSGKAPMRSPLILDRSELTVARHYAVSLGGKANAEFRPDWTLRLHTLQQTTLRTPTGSLPSRKVVLALLTPDHPSSLLHTAARRSRLSLRRGEEVWTLDPLLDPRIERTDATPGGTLSGTFDAVHLELGEGGSERALVAEANGGHAALRFQPDGYLLDEEDGPFRYALQSPRLVRVFGQGAGGEIALVARFHEEPLWVRTDTFALEIGDGPDARFELTGKGNRLHLVYEPLLLRTVTPVVGASTEPVPVAEGTRLRLTHSRVRPKHDPQVAHIRTHPDQPRMHEFIASSFVVSLLRPRDLLSLRLEYYGYVLQTGDGQPPRLVCTIPTPALTAHFPPQHIQEQAFWNDSSDPKGPGETPGGAGAVQTRLAGPSRLCFNIPYNSANPHASDIPFTVEAMLNWHGYGQVVTATAGRNPAGGQAPAAPSDLETAIEAPYRLIMSPNEHAGWAHRPTEGTFNGVSELWHTRLGWVDGSGTVQETPNDGLMTMTAPWSPDAAGSSAPPKYDPTQRPGSSGYDPIDTFRPSLDEHDRYNIVHLTSDSTLNNNTYRPLPLQVERLMLSSLGAWMAVHGVWTPPAGMDVEAWRHQMSMGRDAYVRVVYRGSMFPFGNGASLIRVTERKFVDNGQGVEAALFQHQFVVVRQPERTYTWNADQNASDYPNGWPLTLGGRKMPLKSITLKTLATPPLNLDKGHIQTPVNGSNVDFGRYAFWPTYDGPAGPADVLWHLEATDQKGSTIEFTAPLIFVDSELAQGTQGYVGHKQADVLRALDSYYRGDSRSIIDLHGQKLALAPSSAIPNPLDANKVHDTAMETHQVQFGVDAFDYSAYPNAVPPGDSPWYYPVLDHAQVVIPALKHLMGATGTQKVALNQTYIDHGFGQDSSMKRAASISDIVNKGQVYADLVSSATDPATGVPTDLPTLAFGTTPDGALKSMNGAMVTPGLGTPNTQIRALSALYGTVGGTTPDDVKNLALGQFNPATVFGDETSAMGKMLDAKILGFFTLKDVIAAVNTATGTNENQLTSELGKIPQLITHPLPNPETPTAINVHYEWSTPLQDFLIFVAKNTYTRKGPATLSFVADATVPIPRDHIGVPSPTYKVVGSLKNFMLAFGQSGGSNEGPLLALPFDDITFTLDGARKPDVNANVTPGGIEFGGFLSFINGFKDFMGSFDDPPFLDVDLNGVKAGYTLAIPDITLGAFSLQNIGLGAELDIPFFSAPIHLSFNFASRENPFIMTVYIFGGGGFFQLGFGPHGMTTLEASLEAGVNFALNLGVASGAVRAMLGIYMHWDLDAGKGDLTGFVDIKGNVDVLGLISASIDIYIGLNYETDTGKVAGEAKIEVDVHVLFFHESVTLGPIRKEFVGGGSSPHASRITGKKLPEPPPQSYGGTIQNVMPKDAWKYYCQAFS